MRLTSICKLNTLVIRCTIVIAIVFCADDVFVSFSPFPPFYAIFVGAMSCVAFIVLMVLNIWFLIFGCKFKPIHSAMILLIGFCFVLFGFSPRIFGNAQVRWFLTYGMHQYDDMVLKTIKKTSNLTSEVQQIDHIVGGPNVFAKTNDDGSVLVWFGARSGFFYYSGHELVHKPGNSNSYYFLKYPNGQYYYHLTNSWYMY